MLRKLAIGLAVLSLIAGGMVWYSFRASQVDSPEEPSTLDVTGVLGSRPTALAPSPDAEAPTLDDVLELAEQVLRNLREHISDYSATLVKRERIGGKLGEESRMFIKIRNSDQADQNGTGLCVYLRFDSPDSVAGREVIWKEGQNQGKLIAHEVGFKKMLGRIQLDPNGRLAMLGQKYPLTEIGLIRMAEKLIEKGERPEQLANAVITISNGQKVGDCECDLIQVTNPVDDGLAEFHVAQIFIDRQRMIPLRYAAYMWPEKDGQEPKLEEEYTYLDVKLNVGFEDADFDPDNPEYDYP